MRAAMIGVLLTLAAAGLWGGPARAQLADEGAWATLLRYAVQQLNVPGEFEIELGRIESRDGPSGPETFIDTIAIRDDQGVWLSGRALGVAWDSSAALSGEARFPRIAMAELELARGPVTRGDPPSAEDPEAGLEFAWPRPPIGVAVEALEIEEARIGAALAGAALTGRISGAFVDRGERQQAQLEITRTDGGPALRLSAESDYDFAEDRLVASLTAEEAAGGVVGGLIGAPAEAPLTLAIGAEGGSEGLDLTVQMDAIETLSGAATGRARWRPSVSIRLDGRLTAGARSPAWAQAAAGPDGAALALDLDTTPEGAARLKWFKLESPALTASAIGEVDPAADRVSFDGRFEALEPAAFAGLAGLGALAELSGEATIGGQLSAPEAQVSVTATGLSGAFGRLERFALRGLSEPVKGPAPAPTAPEEEASTKDAAPAPPPLGPTEFSLTLETQGLALADPDLAALIGAAPGLRVVGAAEADGAFEIARLDGAAGAAQVSGRGARAAGAGFDGALTLRLDRAAPLLALIGAPGDGSGAATLELRDVRLTGAGSVALDGRLNGLRFEDPELARLVGRQVALAGAAARAEDGAGYVLGDASLEAAAVAATAEGGFDPAADAIDLSATLTARDPAALGDALGVAFAAAEATAALSGRFSAPTLRIRARADALAAGPVSAEAATAELTAELQRDERTPFELRARLDQATSATEAVTAALGAAPELTASGLFDRAISELRLDAARFAGGALSAEASGRARFAPLGAAAPDVALRWSAAASDLAGLAGVGGALRAEGQLSGALADPAAEATLRSARLAAGGVEIADLAAELSLTGIASGPTGRLDARAQVAGAPAELAAAAAPRDGGLAITLERLAHRGATGAGEALVRNGAATGELSLAAPNLAAFSDLAGVDLSGAARASVRLAPRTAALGVAAQATLSRLALGDALFAETLSARADGPLSALSLALDADGLRAGGFREGAARLRARLADAARLEVSALSLENAQVTVALERPTTLNLSDGARLSPTTLRVNDGRLEFSGAAGRGTTLEARAEDLPLDLAARLGLAPMAAGRLSGTARFDSAPGRGSGDAALRIRGLGVGQAGERLHADELFDATIDGRWDGRRAAIEATLSPPGAEPVRVTAELPVRAGAVPEPIPNGALSAAVAWSGDVARLWPLVPTEAVALSGPTVLDLTLSGPLNALRLGGRAEITDGRLVALETGTDLTALTASVAPQADGSARFTLKARDGGDGTVSGAGAADLTGGGLDATVTADRAVLVRRDDLTARFDVDVAARFGGSAPRLSGVITLLAGEARLIGGGATQPPLIEVATDDAPAAEASQAPPIALDLVFEAPGRLFARGRGLDSEWGGRLQIGGTTAAPQIVGAIDATRGRFAFAGKPFTLSRGAVRFTGPAEPLVDLLLTRETDAISGEIAISGRATQPEIAFASTPALPEDEVLPQLIFGRSLAQLSALEAAQMAAGLATLTSGKPGALDAAREAVGVDTLEVDQGSGGAQVRAGRYVAPGVFVEGRQGVEPGDRSVGVEIELSPEIRLESEAGAAGDLGVGIEWRTDY